MKTALTIIAISIMASTANAKADIGVCLDYSTLATSIMELRQKGAPMSKVLALTLNDDAPDESEWFTEMVIDAYDTPKFSGDEYRQEAITEFGAEQLIACLEARR